MKRGMRPVATAVLAMLSVACACFAQGSGQRGAASQSRGPRILIPLDRGWRFHLGPAAGASEPVFADAAWDAVDVPHVFPPVSDGKRMSVYRGEAWYRKEFTAPQAVAGGQRVFLRFDAVSLVSEVYLNGERLGEHRGGFAAFTYEITGKLLSGAANELAVHVDNRLNNDVSPLETSLLYGGIYRHVSLIVTGAVNITPLDYSSPGVFLTQRAVTADHAEVDVKTEVSNARPAAQEVDLRLTLLDANGHQVMAADAHGEVQAVATVPLTQTLSIPHPHLWNGVADPYLYSVRVELLRDGVVADQVTQPLGLRSFHVDPKHGFVLNGVARQIHGACLHQDWGDKGWAIGPEQEGQDLDILRAMGADGLRLVHYQHSQSALDLYDRTGMLIWSELAQFGRVSGSEAYRENVKQQLIEMIRQNYNHPSIVVWSLWNELNSATKDLSLPIVKELNAVAHAEDPTRPTVGASSGDTIYNAHEVVAAQDLIADNNYAGWYAKAPEDLGPEIDKFNASYGDRGIAISEYGGGARIEDHKQNVVTGEVKPYGPFQPEEWQALVHEGNYRAIRQRPWIWGAFPWLAFDTGGLVQSSGKIEGGNIKGLVTQDRKVRKDAYFFYQANWTTKPMVYLTSKRDTHRTEAKTPVKVYSNAKVVRLTVNGKSYGTQKPDDVHAFHWKSVELSPGENRIEVSTPDGLKDAAVWTYRGDAK